jgi:hypothetical protein
LAWYIATSALRSSSPTVVDGFVSDAERAAAIPMLHSTEASRPSSHHAWREKRIAVVEGS